MKLKSQKNFFPFLKNTACNSRVCRII